MKPRSVIELAPEQVAQDADLLRGRGRVRGAHPFCVVGLEDGL